MLPYTKDRPCRCGFDGTDTHRCHYGRPDPRGTGEDGSDWCTSPAEDRLLATWGSVAGMQPKMSAVGAHYCKEHLEMLKPHLAPNQVILEK